MTQPSLSIVIPVFNECDNIPRIYGELHAVLAQELKGEQAEILFCDNHSTDGSDQVIQGLRQKDPRVRLIRLSRNFGYQANILSGYMASTGDAVVQLDADGEDDPRLIAEFVRLWRSGYQVVYGVRRTRKESALTSFQRKVFYRLVQALSSIPIPVDAGDFRLVDRKVIQAIRGFGEANPYLRGLIAYSGFAQIGLPYDRRARFTGESKFSWWDYLRLAFDGITSFSRKPLAIAAWLGVAFSVVSFLGTAGYLIRHILVGSNAPGFTTLVMMVFFTSGVQLLCLGIMGAYIGRIFEEVKRRPRSIVEYESPT